MDLDASYISHNKYAAESVEITLVDVEPSAVAGPMHMSLDNPEEWQQNNH